MMKLNLFLALIFCISFCSCYTLETQVKENKVVTEKANDQTSDSKKTAYEWGVYYVGDANWLYDVNLQFRANLGFGYGLILKRDGSNDYIGRPSLGVMFQVSPGVSGGKLSIGIGGAQGFYWSNYFKRTYLRTWNDPNKLDNHSNYFGPEIDIGLGFLKISVGYFKKIENHDLVGDKVLSYSIGIGLTF